MRSEADTEFNLAQSAISETLDTINAEDLETRFENLIKAVQEAGFESIDDMSAQYYTATFKEDTVSYWAQSRSRSRFLHAFLASLHASTNKWSDREIQGYRQQILEAAESFHVNELSDAREDFIQNEERRSQTLGENASLLVTQTAMSVQSLWQAIAEMERSQDFKQKKMILREKVCLPMTTLDTSQCLVPKRFDQATYTRIVDAGDLVTSGRVDTKGRLTSTSRVPGSLCFSPSPCRN